MPSTTKYSSFTWNCMLNFCILMGLYIYVHIHVNIQNIHHIYIDINIHIELILVNVKHMFILKYKIL